MRVQIIDLAEENGRLRTRTSAFERQQQGLTLVATYLKAFSTLSSRTEELDTLEK